MSSACSRLAAQLAREDGHSEGEMEKKYSDGNASEALIPIEFRPNLFETIQEPRKPIESSRTLS